MNSRDDDDARRRGACGTARDWRGDDERRGRSQGRGQQEAFAQEFDAWRANRASQSPAGGPGATTGIGSSATGGSGSASPSSRASASSSGAATSGGKESETKQQG